MQPAPIQVRKVNAAAARQRPDNLESGSHVAPAAAVVEQLARDLDQAVTGRRLRQVLGPPDRGWPIAVDEAADDRGERAVGAGGADDDPFDAVRRRSTAKY